MYCSSGHDRWLHVPASCPLPTWHCWLPPEQYDARIRSQYIEPKMRANMARYISHIASLLMLAFYVLHFGMRMRTRIYHLRFGGDTVRAKCWLFLMWFIWFSHMFQHFVVISRMSCWSVFSKRDLLFLINLLIQSVYLYAMLYLHVSVHFYLQAHKHVPGFQVPPGLFTLKWVCVRMYCFTLPLWLAFTPPCDW